MNHFARVVLVLAVTVGCLAAVAAGIQVADRALAHTVGDTSMIGDDDRVLTVWRFLDARNRGDVDGALALIADDATYVDGSTCTPEHPCMGHDAVRLALVCDVARGASTSVVGVTGMAGAQVELTSLTRLDALEAIGLDRILATITADVADGRLIRYRSDPNLSDAQTAWWLGHGPACDSGAQCSERDIAPSKVDSRSTSRCSASESGP